MPAYIIHKNIAISETEGFLITRNTMKTQHPGMQKHTT